MPKRSSRSAPLETNTGDHREGELHAEQRAEPIEQVGAAAIHTGEPMRSPMTAVLAATLGTACGSASRHVAHPRAHHVPGIQAGQHVPGHEHAGHGHHHHAFTNAEAWTQVFDDPARDAWQRPDEVLRALELEPTMVVADIGAGTGYFSVRIARAVSRGEVLATDLEPDMVRFLRERAEREHLLNLRAVQATPTDSGLTARSVDRILIVHVWHHLAEREEYARRLALALRPHGKLFIVDFSLDAERGPPASIRVSPDAVITTLERAGLTARVSAAVLPDQYIVEAVVTP